MSDKPNFLNMRSMVEANVVVLFVLLLTTICGPDAFCQTGARTLLAGSQNGAYPRVIRLAHSGTLNNRLIASFTFYDGSTAHLGSYTSDDDGLTWTALSNTQACCYVSMFEVPQTLGTLSPGTILVAAQGNPIKLYQSLDHGLTYTQRSAVVSNPNGSQGLYEPFLSINAAGNLTIYYSTEASSSSGYNQAIGQKVSTDGGLTWGAESLIVGRTDGVARPGMPHVARLSDGTYILTVEYCGSAGCDAYARTSLDGVSWGDPTNLGYQVLSTANHTIDSSPTLSRTSDGRIILVAQHSNGNSGAILFVNPDDATKKWVEISAPAPVTSPGYNFCQNYSSSTLPSLDNSKVLEIVGDYDSNGVCSIYVGTSSLPLTPKSGAYASGLTLADSNEDFQLNQSAKHWTYGYYSSGTSFVQDSTNDGNSWQGPDAFSIVAQTGQHPGASYPSVRRWTSNFSGIISLTGSLKKLDVGGGDGVTGQVVVNGTSIWSQSIAYNDTTGTTFSLNAAVNVGDTVDFVLSGGANNYYDYSSFTATVAEKAYADSTSDFSFVQGNNNWRYGYFSAGTTFVQDSTHDGTFWDGPDSYSLIGQTGQHPGASFPSVKRWTSNISGNVHISGTLSKLDTTGGDGVVGQVFVNGSQIWSQSIAGYDGTGVVVSVDATIGVGDVVDFALNKGSNNSDDYSSFAVAVAPPHPAQ